MTMASNDMMKMLPIAGLQLFSNATFPMAASAASPAIPQNPF